MTFLNLLIYMRSFFYPIIVLTVSVPLFVFSCTNAETGQEDFGNRKSPIAIAKINHENTYVKIVYGQPYKNNRTIFGELVPYDEVWRTGANEATELTTTGHLSFGDKKLDPGTYALFTIPRPDTWTIILNKSLGQWGAFEYDSGMDILRIDVPASTTEEVTEVFTIQFGEVTGDKSSIILRWDTTEVQIPIRFGIPSDSSTT